MLGIELHKIFDLNHHMRCSDRYGSHPERDGAILIGILVGKCAVILTLFSKGLEIKKCNIYTLGVLIGIPLAMGILLIYRRGCFGFLGYGPGPADYSRAFYKRAGHQDDLNI